MDNLVFNLDNLKVSALSKSKHINSFVKSTTIGPNKSFIEGTDYPLVINESLPSRKKDKNVKCEKANSSMVINKLCADIEQERQRKLQKALDSRINHVVEYSKQSHFNLNKKLEIKRKRLISEKNQQELLILRTLEQHDKDMTAQHQQLLHYYEELAERKRKIDRELKEYERRKQLLSLLIDKIKNDQVEFRYAYQDIITNLESCKYPVELKLILGDIPHKLKSLPNEMDEIVNKCKTGRIREDENIKSAQLVIEIKDILNNLKQKILKVTEEQEMKKQHVVTKPKVVIKRLESMPLGVQPAGDDVFISKTSLQIYVELQNFLETFTNSYSDLTNNDTFKQFKFDCKKAINIPVNAISAVNSQHLLDKYSRLSNLLAGKTVEVGGTRICASRHPKGIAFSSNLLAKKFVLQGDLMISSKPEAAYCYAATIIALWNDYPNFGKLLLAHFYKQCPYLVPFYPPQVVGQSDKEYYLSLGYEYNNNVIEKQDKFLKRMTGIMRLYSAVIISKPKRGQQKNPHGISEGWRWLSSFLNLQPKPDITATMLHIFLETVGSTMQAVYGKLFKKLMNFVCQNYLPMIQKIDTGGPVTRLEGLLLEYRKVGRFEEPRGTLSNHFW